MGYMIMPVYSFSCDDPAPEPHRHNGVLCGEYESLPAGDGLAGAVREIRSAGWTVTGTGRNRRFYCPDHKPEPAPACSACGATENLTSIESGTLVCEDYSACLERTGDDR